MKENSAITLEQIPVGSYKNFSYLVFDNTTSKAVIFDPAWEIESLSSRIREGKLQLECIVNTHAHFDHIEGNLKLKEKTGAKIIMFKSSHAVKDIGVRDGEEMRIGENLRLKFLHTPGHSPESMCILVNDEALITGDTLFVGECGRVDLPGGDANELYDSFQKIKSLDRKLIIYPGHDYGKTKTSTLERELKENYTLAERTREEFAQFMNTP